MTKTAQTKFDSNGDICDELDENRQGLFFVKIILCVYYENKDDNQASLAADTG